MDWQLLGLSFITVFLAELGDKSQLAAIAIGGSSNYPRAVFFGTVTALLLASFLGVVAGEGVAQVLPADGLKLFAAAGFMVISLRLLWVNYLADTSESDGYFCEGLEDSGDGETGR